MFVHRLYHKPFLRIFRVGVSCLWMICVGGFISGCTNIREAHIATETQLREMVQVDPIDYHARFDLAMFLMQTQLVSREKDGDTIRESRRLFEELLNEFPDDVTADIARAATIQLEAEWLTSTDFSARSRTLTMTAVREMDAIIEKNSDNVMARILRARVYAGLAEEWDKQETAYEDFGIAIEWFEQFSGDDTNSHVFGELILLYKQKDQLARKLKTARVDRNRLKELRRLQKQQR